MSVLWTAEEIAAATGGEIHGNFAVGGVTFDSREVEPGDLFVAMPGTRHDGHQFVPMAFQKGAHGALVSEEVKGPHILVPDVAAALDALARAARERLSEDAVVIGVTGSVGKTSTKEALYAALERSARGRAHRSVKSYNNHTGVPLSVARTPRDVRFAVFEMGMNHAGEIAELVKLVRPHIALVTAIAPAHIENLGTIEAIADAKAEIFTGLEEGGTAILPEDSPHRDRLIRAARGKTRHILTFGSKDADAALLHAVPARSGGSLVTARLRGREVTYTIAQKGDHWIANSLAVLAAVEAAGGDVAQAGLALADMAGLKGRGERHVIPVDDGQALLIDESYNANSASMKATLASLGREEGRKIAVLGAMKELGEQSAQLHADLAAPILDAGIEQLILVGEEMAPLEAALEGKVPLARVDDAGEATDAAKAILRPGDAILVKASNSVGLAKLVEALAGGRPCST
ncbi:UDP-N-acetylmuramoyl-tripeptide--D-alanyl-D-alanine ligase [Sphingomicrobium lutaoense]|uniref:UDP-N-acetylmuramoyl-tripeptide--D-alanyl-D-alanine ligase n=1 Tax=Sphingomicrobium lutaoense TaxID=515949 RepID=A0A839Z104_9SPHN|nr:UDP-N-acetylmuramoyl-tripeptide--D-alanyl-D-alanine ligase [Sphingomicrobium lutaoense]MBB3764360.1 UDP-N-acetylmuramoyl-tripeptide--D-alanyl-D-alanine ligase [Sphingomicrobium lutaoense]